METLKYLTERIHVCFMTKHHNNFMKSETKCSLWKCITYVIFIGTYQSFYRMETMLLTIDKLVWTCNNETERLFTVFFFLWKTLAFRSLKGLFSIFEKRFMLSFKNKSRCSEHVSHMTDQVIVSKQVMWLIVTSQTFYLNNRSEFFQFFYYFY